MTVSPVGSSLPDERESVPLESRHEISRRERTEASIIDGHTSDGDGDAGCLRRYFGYFNIASRTFGQRFPLFDELLNDHVDHFVDVLKRFSLRGSPG